MSMRWSPFLAGFLLLSSSSTEAQDVDVCPNGWQAVAESFLKEQLDANWNEAAQLVCVEERESWLEWMQWQSIRLETRKNSMSKAALDNEDAEKTKQRNRLGTSVFTCRAIKGATGEYSVKVDPDGRSYQFLNLNQDESERWGVRTHFTSLTAEQRKMLSAYFLALDDLNWEEAQAWVAQQAVPRFLAYRREVEAYYSGSESIRIYRKTQQNERLSEWGEMFMRAVVESDGIVVVHLEFPTATKLSCEMLHVDGTWRVLLR